MRYSFHMKVLISTGLLSKHLVSPRTSQLKFLRRIMQPKRQFISGYHRKKFFASGKIKSSQHFLCKNSLLLRQILFVLFCSNIWGQQLFQFQQQFLREQLIKINMFLQLFIPFFQKKGCNFQHNVIRLFANRHVLVSPINWNINFWQLQLDVISQRHR